MFFDIGSNVGLWSIANIHNTSKIISIEASPTTFEILLKNTRDNKNIENLNYVVSNNNCEDITFYEAEARN